MVPRLIAVVSILALASTAQAADPPKPDLRPPLDFKDLTPPKLPDHGHGGHPEVHDAEELHTEGSLFFSMEYLLLRPRRGAFDFALSDPNRDLVPSGAVQYLNYELRSGLRAGVGYRFADSRWDAKFEYTYLDSSADRSIAAPPGGTLYATLTRPGLNDEANTALATAGLQYNVFDTTAGRMLHIGHDTALRLFGGFRFAAIRQNFNSTYNGGDANQGIVNTESNFDGFGPLFGGEIVWQVHNGWHLYGRGSAALVTGRNSNPISETNNGGLTLYSNLEATDRRVVPVSTLALGGGWHSGHVSFRVGYEITNWFGLIDTPRLSGELAEGKFTTRSTDLSLEGIFVQFGLTY